VPPSERLLLLDPGDLRTRAAAFDPATLAPLGSLEMESAVAPRDAGPSLLPAYAGLEGGPEEDPVPPLLDPETGAALAVGSAAADTAGYGATLAAGCEPRKLLALASAALFLLAEDGVALDLVIVADPGAKADRVADLVARWSREEEVAVTALDPSACSALGAEGETRRLRVRPRLLDAGAALLELCFARGHIEPDGPPALVLDLGHRSTRAYLLDPSAGVVDLEVVPHGGASYLEHARRLSAEARDRGRDVSLLRQLAQGTDTLHFGAVTRLTRRFFEEARRELARAVAGAVATRLRRHLERGAAWPRTLVLCGGLAIPDGGEVASELRARGCAFQRVRSLPRSPSALLEGALEGERLARSRA
jgi:hypothetical protein